MTKTAAVVSVAAVERGIDVEPAVEDLYLRMIHCYRRLQRRIEALVVYRRCETAISELLQVKPTPPLRVLYEEL